jgi:outer membrane protein OmpA-like peptidoglycan-associated protein
LPDHSTGSLEYNIKLSNEGAQSVVKILIEEYQVKRARLGAESVGTLSPIMSNAANKGRAKNSRVELVEK